MKQYECDLCGYVYDEAAGDPDNGIAPGTKWRTCPPTGCAPCAAPERTSSPLSEKKSRVQRTRDFFLRRVASDAGRGYPALQCGDSGRTAAAGSQNEASGGLADPHGQGVEGERGPEAAPSWVENQANLRTYQHHIADHRRQGRQRL